MGKQLILAFFASEAAADDAVKQVKDWDRISPDIKLGAIGILVKDDKGKIKTQKLGTRRTGTGALLFGLASLLSGGLTVLGGLLIGGVFGSLFHKGLGLSKADMAHLDAELDGGKAAVGLMVNPDEVVGITGFLSSLGARIETHEMGDAVVEQAEATAAEPAEQASAAAPAVASAASADVAEHVKLAAEAYIYGYPLVYNLTEMAKFPGGPNLVGPQALPYNTVGYARQLLGPDAHFVSPNNDTLYMIAICDVREGPLVLHTPDTADRYYVLQFVDAWTNNFAYIGRRATGTAEADYVLAARDYAAPIPEGMHLVCAPTGMFAIVGRIAVNGEADLPTAHALQDQFTLAPLAGGEPTAVAGVPEPDARVRDDAQVVGGVPGGTPGVPAACGRRAVPGDLREAGADRSGIALRECQPGTGAGAGRGPAGRTEQDRGTDQHRGQAGQRLAGVEAPVRLQRWTSSKSARWTRPSGLSPTGLSPMSRAPWWPGRACGAITAMRPTIALSMWTRTTSRSTAITGTN